MLSSFTRDEKKLLVGLALLLGLGSSMNLILGSRAREPFEETAPLPARKSIANAATTTATLRLAADSKTTAPTIAARSIASVQASGKIDLNLATAEALQTLPGIGPRTAETILGFRSQNGAFRSVQELENVKGIGPAKMEQILPHVEVNVAAGTTAQSASAAPLAPPQAARAVPVVNAPPQNQPRTLSAAGTPLPTGPININIANEEQLSTLDSIGPVLARRIIEFRNQHGLFPSVDSLDRVKGIGPRILQANRHRITVR